tara:strand:+ start:869 stop:1276 length:408 start_codon:yes stop_codon:yes gene_type:complete
LTPIFQSQNNFSNNRTTKTIETINVTSGVMLNAKKYSTITKGKRNNPKALSKRKEKKTPNFAISCTLKILPNKSITPILIIKNSITPTITLKVSKTEFLGVSLRMISEIFIDINKKVIKLTLSVKAFSCLKYWLA